MYNGVKNQCFDVIYGVEDFEVHSVHMQVNYLVTWVIQFIRTCAYLFPNSIHISFKKKPKRFSFIFKIFLWVSYLKSLTIPHLPTWEIEGFKGLVLYAKCNHDSYDNERGLSFSYFLFLLSLFYFTRGRAKSWCGVICSCQKYIIFTIL